MLCLALICAPFALGSIPPLAITVLVKWLFAAAFLWTLDCILEQRTPRFPRSLLISATLVMLLGWFMTWNARSVYMPIHGSSVSIRPPFPFAPGSENQTVSLLAMLRLSALLATLFVVADLTRRTVWKTRLLYALAFAGAGIALFGLIQQAGLVKFVAAKMNPYEGIYFSTFNYHANAGAYLNLALPPLCVLTLMSFLTHRSIWRRIVLFAMLALVIVATFANTSRGAQAITVGLLLGLIGWGVKRLLAKSSALARSRRMVLPVVIVLMILAIGAMGFGYSRNAKKWRQLPEQLSKNSSRWQVWRIAVPMAREGGPLGKGPGMFKMLLPRSPLLSDALYSRWIIQAHIPGEKISMWSMAHNDYLQAWVEFGWAGACLLGVIFFGGIARGIGYARRRVEKAARPYDFTWIGIVASLLGVTVHATFDFPLQIASLQLTVAVLLGMCWRLPPSPTGKSPASASGEKPEFPPALPG